MLMQSEIPPSLLECSDKETLVDAIYFVIRTLRNGTREYKAPRVSTEPSREVRELAESAISEIEAREKRSIRDLDSGRSGNYISLLEELMRTEYRHAVGGDSSSAASILEEMRASRRGG
jgi:hypothetical protein